MVITFCGSKEIFFGIYGISLMSDDALLELAEERLLKGQVLWFPSSPDLSLPAFWPELVANGLRGVFELANGRPTYSGCFGLSIVSVGNENISIAFLLRYLTELMEGQDQSDQFLFPAQVVEIAEEEYCRSSSQKIPPSIAAAAAFAAMSRYAGPVYTPMFVAQLIQYQREQPVRSSASFEEDLNAFIAQPSVPNLSRMLSHISRTSRLVNTLADLSLGVWKHASRFGLDVSPSDALYLLRFMEQIEPPELFSFAVDFEQRFQRLAPASIGVSYLPLLSLLGAIALEVGTVKGLVGGEIEYSPRPLCWLDYLIRKKQTR